MKMEISGVGRCLLLVGLVSTFPGAVESGLVHEGKAEVDGGLLHEGNIEGGYNPAVFFVSSVVGVLLVIFVIAACSSCSGGYEDDSDSEDGQNHHKHHHDQHGHSHGKHGHGHDHGQGHGHDHGQGHGHGHGHGQGHGPGHGQSHGHGKSKGPGHGQEHGHGHKPGHGHGGEHGHQVSEIQSDILNQKSAANRSIYDPPEVAHNHQAEITPEVATHNYKAPVPNGGLAQQNTGLGGPPQQVSAPVGPPQQNSVPSGPPQHNSAPGGPPQQNSAPSGFVTTVGVGDDSSSGAVYGPGGLVGPGDAAYASHQAYTPIVPQHLQAVSHAPPSTGGGQYGVVGHYGGVQYTIGQQGAGQYGADQYGQVSYGQDPYGQPPMGVGQQGSGQQSPVMLMNTPGGPMSPGMVAPSVVGSSGMLTQPVAGSFMVPGSILQPGNTGGFTPPVLNPVSNVNQGGEQPGAGLFPMPQLRPVPEGNQGVASPEGFFPLPKLKPVPQDSNNDSHIPSIVPMSEAPVRQVAFSEEPQTVVRRAGAMTTTEWDANATVSRGMTLKEREMGAQEEMTYAMLDFVQA